MMRRDDNSGDNRGSGLGNALRRMDEENKRNPYVPPGERSKDAQRWDDGQLPPRGPGIAAVPDFTIAPVLRKPGGSGDVSVNTSAVKYFAEVVGNLAKDVDEAVRELGKVKVLPGNFYDADLIVQKIGDGSSAGLKAVYLERMRRLKAGLLTLSARMTDLAKRYETTEKLNAAGAGEVAELMKQVGAALGTGAPGITPKI